MPLSNASNDDDTAALLDALEHEESNPVYNSQRIAQIKAELSSTNTSQSNPIADTTPSSAGTVTTLLNNSPLPSLPTDQAVLDFTTQLSHCILHFSHPDFARCATMDKHLTCLSTAHSSSSGARFARVDVRNVPFIVEKLKIRVLPCVIGFVDGEVRERVLGFEGLGTGGLDALGDDFDTGVLEDRFVKKGILSGVKIGRKGRDDDGQSDGSEDWEEKRNRGKKSIRSGRRKVEDDDSDWD
ncbi:hypothetical protein D8B26_006490 [Coccidioides posadasii str. Silveira]|uniref:GTPase inhibitor n=2 Tax=Coccidioides posadasii TaxID=199306 RepID=E9CTE0_COCPS|nr:GTPase inhibitor [Coccidioides posadasii str. Silveira]KMM67274.1 GTPase inhibitor [Coccidioides posadasii RMSCC 3488]QVM11847.1 hypothetical protein D8B26_006490 [Coccidioides posadasii str. Silveira]